MHHLRHALVAILALPLAAWAQPALVRHDPAAAVFNQPAGITQREPEIPREGQATDLWIKIGPSFTYDRVWLYYTTDGSEPQGAAGVAQTGSTRVLASIDRSNPARPASIFFQFNQPNGFGGNDDWWKVTLPPDFAAREFNTTVRYKISAQQGSSSEIFANTGGSPIPFAFTNRLAWPGAGAGQPNPAEGYPPVNFWKEEAFIGNTFTAAMLDQNGSWFDFFFPTTGGIQGVGTRNEGYSEGPDTFPPLLTREKRGQMHLNKAMIGIRTDADNTTHWLSNPAGVSYSQVDQAYASTTTNTVFTTQRLAVGGNDILVRQWDFAPAGISFPQGAAGAGPQRHILVKRVLLRNQGAQPRSANVYLYMDPAINGGDTYDVMFWDPQRGAMTAYDKTRRTVFGQGAFITPPEEYNITTFNGYQKNVALYMTAAMKLPVSPGAAGGDPAGNAWRDTSPDNGQGWIGAKISLPPGQDVEVNFALIGAHLRPDPITAPIPTNDGVYDNQITPALDWFLSNSMAQVQAATDAYWQAWVNSGTTVDTPDDRFDELMNRGKLATALHQDAVNGGIVAGYHNGAYPYVWPRDAMWAAVTLARTGHLDEARNALRWMREITFRANETNRGTNPWTGQPYKSFWYQKYTTDGFIVWSTPQVDETAVFPWALKWVDDMTADNAFLELNYGAMRDSVRAMSEDSQLDNRIFFVDPPNAPERQNLMHSNNLWEDQFGEFIYSNANIVRGLRDAAAISSVLGRGPDAADAQNRAATIKSGLDARLDWNGENTDASLLGIVYPFEIYSPTDPRAVRVIDRINGVATDRFGNNRPLVRFAGFPNDQYGWTNLIDRYWGDSYWGGGTPWGAGPWFLTTMWYGCYYAMRQDLTPGTGDIDNHKMRLNLLIDRLGPVGLGAEQISPRAVQGDPARPGSLLYPGQDDFQLQAAWPNAWESMSFFVDSIMMFLDYEPDARANRMNFRPKLPGGWSTMTFRNVRLVNTPAGLDHSVDVTVERDNAAGLHRHTFVNRSGAALSVSTALRVPAGSNVYSVRRNGQPVPFTYDAALGSVRPDPVALETGAGATTEVRAVTQCQADLNGDGVVDFNDFLDYLNLYNAQDPQADLNGDGVVDFNDLLEYLNLFNAGC